MLPVLFEHDHGHGESAWPWKGAGACVPGVCEGGCRTYICRRLLSVEKPVVSGFLSNPPVADGCGRVLTSDRRYGYGDGHGWFDWEHPHGARR
jgi:hypothetical protein